MRIIIIVMVALVLTACAERAPAEVNESAVQVDCNLDRFNVRCPNPFGGAQ